MFLCYVEPMMWRTFFTSKRMTSMMVTLTIPILMNMDSEEHLMTFTSQLILYTVGVSTINAQINILNILPRASVHRNNIINKLNQYLIEICFKVKFLNYINTEHCRSCLFSSNDGFIKATFSKSIGSDNV